MPRGLGPNVSGAVAELVQKWWAVHDRHIGRWTTAGQATLPGSAVGLVVRVHIIFIPRIHSFTSRFIDVYVRRTTPGRCTVVDNCTRRVTGPRLRRRPPIRSFGRAMTGRSRRWAPVMVEMAGAG